jgi:hypothetical protein
MAATPWHTKIAPRTVLTMIFVGAVVAVCAVAFVQFNRARTLRAYSQVHSIAKALQSLEGVSVLSEEAWRPPNEAEISSLLQTLFSTRQPNSIPDKMALTDPWGRRIHILRRVYRGKLDYAVWSDGPDRLPGTADDIRVPDAGSFPKLDPKSIYQ